VLLGNGSNQLFQTLLTGVLEPGDKVLYFPPTFSLFQEFTEIYAGDLITVYFRPGREFPLKSALSLLQQHRPKLVLICTPNNPTGGEISLAAIAEICERAPGLVFCDEAYGEFCTQTACDLLQRFPRLIVSRTFSKAFSLAGLRFGYYIADPGTIRQLQKVNLPYNVNLFTETAVSTLLDRPQFMESQVQYLVEERERMYSAMSAITGIRVFPSTANFLLFGYPEGRDLFNELKAKGVLVRDLKGYPLLEHHARLTVGSREENDLFLQILSGIL
jgi:histidinol-phosphate aminotransferase